jgi:hypothetical protein
MANPSKPLTAELSTLKALFLNILGNVLLHNLFRALFMLKALKNEEAVHIVSKGDPCSHFSPLEVGLGIDTYMQGFRPL